jgi:hypothetical protein
MCKDAHPFRSCSEMNILSLLVFAAMLDKPCREAYTWNLRP